METDGTDSDMEDNFFEEEMNDDDNEICKNELMKRILLNFCYYILRYVFKVLIGAYNKIL